MALRDHVGRTVVHSALDEDNPEVLRYAGDTGGDIYVQDHTSFTSLALTILQKSNRTLMALPDNKIFDLSCNIVT